MDRDRNLLFGVLAAQLKKVTASQIMEAAGAWATDPSRDLPSRLVEAGALSERDRKLIEHFVDEAVSAHDGDASATLQTFGGEEQVHQSFHGSIVLTESGGIRTVVTPRPADEPVDPDLVPAVQETPGRYSLVGEHGRGGMGKVLLVHDEHLGRDIALKELLLPSAPSVFEGEPEAPSPVRLSVPMMARFLQEARITGQLEHPSIVPVYELGHRKDGTLYYTMKLVRGQTLSKALKDATSLRERLALLPHFVDLCQAVAYAHSRGVIHRDIKPSNVMVGEFGETFIIDWGLAKARDRRDIHAEDIEETFRVMRVGDEAEVAQTVYGHAIGTPVYMPPEQAKGQLDQVDERSDVYSLGAVLYELVTGKTPFTGATTREVMEKVIAEPPEPILGLESEAPPELVAICERAMQKEPKKRYQSAKEIAEEVQRFQSGALVRAYEYKFSEHLRRFVGKHKVILSTVAAASVILLAVGVFSYVRVLHERALAIRERERAEDAQQKEIDWRRQFFDREAQALEDNFAALKEQLSRDKRHPVESVVIVMMPTQGEESNAFLLTLRRSLKEALASMQRFKLTMLQPEDQRIRSVGFAGLWDAGASLQELLGKAPCDVLMLVRLQENDSLVEAKARLFDGATAQLRAYHSIRWDRDLTAAAENIATGLAYGLLSKTPPREALAAAFREEELKEFHSPLWGERVSITVLPFKYLGTDAEYDPTGLTDVFPLMLGKNLTDSGRFVLTKRGELVEEIVEEARKSSDGGEVLVHPILLCKLIVSGEIQETDAGFLITAVLADTETRKQVAAAETVWSRDLDPEVAVQRIAEQLVAAYPRAKGRVMSWTDGKIEIDIGETSGALEGMILQVIEADDIVDPGTEESLELITELIAWVRIIETAEDSVTCEVIEELAPIEEGMTVVTW